MNAIPVVEDTANDDIGFSSSLEIDAYVSEQVNFFLMLKSAELQKSYDAFNEGNQSLSSLLAVNIMFSVFTFPFFVIECFALSGSRTILQIANSIVLLASVAIIDFLIWRAYFIQKANLKDSDSAKRLAPAVGRLIQAIHMRIFMAIELVSSFKLISRVVGGNCGDSNSFVVISSCNPAAHYHAIPDDACMILMLVPLLYAMMVKGAHFRFATLLWAITMVTMIAATLFVHAYNSVLFICVYFLGSAVILVESRKASYFHFFTHRKLQETLQERQKAADEANASEMRHMIANVAHDLKTV